MKTKSFKNIDQHSNTILHEDKRFVISLSDIRTRTCFYPVLDTTGKIRRDLFFGALFFALIVGHGLWRYFDLWYEKERLMMGGVMGIALLIGTQVSMLELSARGYPSKIFIARSSTIKKIFDAITQARARAAQAGNGFEVEEEGGDEC